MDYEIETERLWLRRPRLDDAEVLFERVASRPNVTRYVSWPMHVSVETTRTVLTTFETVWLADGIGPLVIVERSSGKIIGTTGLTPKGEGVAETGYVLAADAWGEGFATETLRAVVEWAGEKSLRRLTACVHPDNQASIRVLERSGFVLRSRCRGCAFPNLDGGESVAVLDYELAL